jgi:hypothetical protein
MMSWIADEPNMLILRSDLAMACYVLPVMGVFRRLVSHYNRWLIGLGPVILVNIKAIWTSLWCLLVKLSAKRCLFVTPPSFELAADHRWRG